MSERQAADHEARRRAIEGLDRHQFLDAGAGAGKTSVLVEHYLWILEGAQSVGPRQIVAVTFTRKAAAEMKQRLRAECRKRAAGDDGGRWQQMARELETAPIDTIHGLCSRILHENAVAARVDPGFTVIEGVEQQFLLEETVRRSLLERLDAEAETAAELVAQLDLAGACEAVQRIIAGRARLAERSPATAALLPDGRAPSAEELQARWEALAGRAQELLLELQVQSPAWREARATLTENRASSEGDVLEQLRIKRLGLIAEAEDEGRGFEGRLDALRGLMQGSVQEKKADAWPDEDVKARVAEALRSFSTSNGANREGIDEILGAAEPGGEAGFARLTSALAHEAAAALEAYEAAKRGLSALDFDDLQLRVRDLWRERPEVLKAYRDRLRHVLVDEFQDTDELQKEILWPLAEGGAQRFVVGDAKQSIYRFRSADVRVFNRTRDEMAQAAGSAVERLAVNFRSTPAMTAFFNELFSHEQVMGGGRRHDFQARYEPLLSHREWEGAEAVEVYVVTGPDEEAPEEEGEDQTLGALREKEAALLARRIRELVEGGEAGAPGPVALRSLRDRHATPGAHEGAARYGDFGMLFRAMTDVPTYERALREAGVPYYVVAGRGFYNRQEVRDVVNCLRAIENRRDEVALIGALRSPLFSLSDATLFWLSRVEGSWWERLQGAARAGELSGALAQIKPEELEKLRFAASTLEELRARKNRVNLARLVSEIIERTGISAVLATRFGGDQMVSNLRKLADLAGEFEQSGDHSLRGLILRLQELVVREEREGEAPIAEEESDVVKLMTIHAAKGLEWPIVVVPDLARTSGRDRSGGVISHPDWGVIARGRRDAEAAWPAVGLAIKALNEAEELAEARRLFYVACTRARDRLILSSAFTSWKRGTGKTALKWLCEALRIDPQTPGETALESEGWSGRARVVPGNRIEEPQAEVAGVRVRPLAVAVQRTGPATDDTERADSRGARRLDGGRPWRPHGDTRDLKLGGDTRDLDDETVRRLVRRVAPLARERGAEERFHATQLATYLDCPRRYELRYLEGAPEEMPAPPTLDPAERLSPIEFGEAVHRLLRIVGAGGKQRLEWALAQGLALEGRAALRAEGNVAAIRGTLEAYLESSLYRELVAPAARLRTEMTVLFAAAGALLEGKIDALVEDRAGGLHILDFKTGRRSERAAHEHDFQLGLYCAGVTATARGNLASAAIVYLNEQAPEVAAAEAQGLAGRALAAASEAIAGIRAGRFEAARGERCGACPLGWACGNGEG